MGSEMCIRDSIIGVWRGGTPIGVAVQEFFSVLGVPSDHIAIRTSHYTGIDERGFDVKVYGLNYIIKQVESEDSLLIVDDVHDTGVSIEKIVSDLKVACKKNTPEIRIATPYFKPSKNTTNRKPDYYLHETCLLYTSPSPRDRTRSRMPSSA